MIFKQSTTGNRVWNRAKSPVLGLLLLLSVCPLLGDNSEAKSDVKHAQNLSKDSNHQQIKPTNILPIPWKRDF